MRAGAGSSTVSRALPHGMIGRRRLPGRVDLDVDSLREVARALLVEAKRCGAAIELCFENGRLVGFGVVPDPACSETEREGRTMAFEGTREVRATEVGVTATKAGREGKPYVGVQVRVSPGQGEGSGRRYTWKGWLDSPEKRERTVKALRALGWTGGSLRALEAGKMEGLGTRAATCEFQIERNPNDGREYSTPAFINEIPRLRLEHVVDVEAMDWQWGADFAAAAHTEDGEVVEDDFPGEAGASTASA